MVWPAGRNVAMPPWPKASTGWLLVAVLPALQLTFGKLEFRGDAVLGLLYPLGAAMGAYAGAIWATRSGPSKVIEWMCVTIVAASIVSLGLALAQWLKLGAISWWAMELIEQRPYANLAQPNHFGLLMVMGMVSASALRESRLISSRAVWALTCALFGFGILICQSRASLIALLGVGAFWIATHSRVTTRLHIVDVLIGMAAIIAGTYLLPHVEDALLLRPEEVRSVLDAGPREWIWLHYWAAILQRPWFGFGFNQSVAALASVAESVHPSRNATYAHNFVLDLMTWFGIPLALAITTGLVAWILGWLRKAPDDAAQARQYWVFAIWLALVCQSLLEFPFAYTYFLLPACVMAGAINRTRANASMADVHTAGSPRLRSLTAVAIAGLGSVLTFALARDYFVMEEEFRTNRFARANFVGQTYAEGERAFVLDQLEAANETAKIVIRPGMTAEELSKLERVARRFHFLYARMDYAKALALNGRMGEAEAELRKLRGIYHPTHYARIERDWNQWLGENRARIASVAASTPSAGR
jgi:hypothetical protein